MLEIIPLGRLQIDVNQLLSIGRQAYGRTLSAQLDHKKIPVDKAASLLTILAEMLGPVDHFSIQKNPGNLLDHLFYSFLLFSGYDTVCEILEQTKLSVHTSESSNGTQVTVVSGTMRTWKDSIIDGSGPNSKRKVRLFCNKCMLYFETEGFKPLWSDYKSELGKDKTIKLLEKT